MPLVSLATEPFVRLWRLASGLVRAYAEVFFLSRATVGLVLLVGTLLNWNVGVCGLIAVAAACLFARLVGMGSRLLESGFYTYNPLLVGLSLGAKLSLTPLTAVLIAIAGMMTFMLTAAAVHVLRYYFSLPVLTLPFVLAGAVAHVAALHYSSLPVEPRAVAPYLAGDFGLPLLIPAFFKTLGCIFFVPSVPIGMVFSLILWVRSRILFFLAVGGYAFGVLLRGSLVGSYEQAAGDMMNFNFMLVAMALGGVFLVPSWSSFLIAAVGVAVSMVLVDAVQVFSYAFAVPFYTLPFNLVTLGVVYALTICQYQGMTRYFGATPEETLENDLVRRARFDHAGRGLALPFHGAWSVWQGCDGPWTHKGPWQHAFDFVITDHEGNTHADDGTELKDYYCFRKPVLSPCRARVVAVVDDLPDNPINRVNKTHNWGNYVLLLDDRGFYVELSHFAYQSIKVRVGDRVEPGHLLGLCGNSGYSPQPHLHIHVQLAEPLGSPTVPFSFVRYATEQTFFADARPQCGERVEPAAVLPTLDAATDYLLNQTLCFDLFEHDRPAGKLELAVKMAVDGTLYFESSAGGRLYFGKHNGTFYCYRLDGSDRWLAAMYRALPSLPLVRAGRWQWNDVVPIGLVASGWRRALAHLVAPFFGGAALAHTSHRYVAEGVIETVATSAMWGIAQKATAEVDELDGLMWIETGGLELVRTADTLTEESPVDDTDVVSRSAQPSSRPAASRDTGNVVSVADSAHDESAIATE
ncbi:MAG: urea transporter [Planctomycetes bacterium]|nr:urea transporter [Planctomycetota bacterium]